VKQQPIHGFEVQSIWSHVKRNDARARELADRHYSRQTIGAIDFMASGKTFVLWAENDNRGAVWGAIENLDPAGGRRFRCSIFRNETSLLSSDLVREATKLTLDRWRRRFHWDGTPPLQTEIDPAKTRRKRDPGRCFRKAGWVEVDERRGLVILEAPFKSVLCPSSPTTAPHLTVEEPPRFELGNGGFAGHLGTERALNRARSSDEERTDGIRREPGSVHEHVLGPSSEAQWRT